MNQPRKRTALLQILLGIGIILLIPLFFAVRPQARQTPEATNTPPASAAPTRARATLTMPIPTGQEPPACSFPLAQTTTVQPASQRYTFSDPKVVASDTGSDFGSVKWLPDNRHVLLTRDHIRVDADGAHIQSQSIELFDPQTGDTQVYAVSQGFSELPPVWVPSLNAVMYQVSTILFRSYDSQGMLQYPLLIRRQLFLNAGGSANVQTLEDRQVTVGPGQPNGASFTVAVKPDGSQLVYVDEVAKQQILRKISKGSLGAAQPSIFDPSPWDYRRPGSSSLPLSYTMSWRPGASQIFLYSPSLAGGYTYLRDIDSAQLCELDLFAKADQTVWVMTADWSRDGRYLAVLRAPGLYPVHSIDLMVLDTITGKVYEVSAAKLNPSGTQAHSENLIGTFTWAPDDRHLAVIADSDGYPSDRRLHRTRGLYLVDFLTGQSIQISPSTDFGSDEEMIPFDWSDDGSKLLVECPVRGTADRLCLLSVHQSDRP